MIRLQLKFVLTDALARSDRVLGVHGLVRVMLPRVRRGGLIAMRPYRDLGQPMVDLPRDGNPATFGLHTRSGFRVGTFRETSACG